MGLEPLINTKGESGGNQLKDASGEGNKSRYDPEFRKMTGHYISDRIAMTLQREQNDKKAEKNNANLSLNKINKKIKLKNKCTDELREGSISPNRGLRSVESDHLQNLSNQSNRQLLAGLTAGLSNGLLSGTQNSISMNKSSKSGSVIQIIEGGDFMANYATELDLRLKLERSRV